MGSEELLQCYNRTCGAMFDPSKNSDDSCCHHPGLPVFHDVYKKWSCCDKKTTDFTEFLDIKGCTKSCHSNVKPPEPPKPSPSEQDIKEVIRAPLSRNPQSDVDRPDADGATVPLSVTISPSLQSALEKLKCEISEPTDKDVLVIPGKTPCLNRGCKSIFKGDQSGDEMCLYHSGVPIFHEGMKYWTCCVKRTTDFDSFLEQAGCTTGKHKWIKDKNAEDSAKCRYDWHQTGSFVVVSVYTKLPIPHLSCAEANPVKLDLRISFGKDREVFKETVVLFGVIDVGASSITYYNTKVEVKLKKAHPISWKELYHKEVSLSLNKMNLS